MLSIQEVHYFTRLADKKLVDPIKCPTARYDETHFIISKVDDDLRVFFRCVDCSSDFRLGLRSEINIKNTIDKFLNQG